MSKRSLVEKTILDFATDIDPSKTTYNVYTQLFKTWDDKRFSRFMDRLKEYGYIPIFTVPERCKDITSDLLLGLAKKYGHNFMDRLVIYDPSIGEEYTTPKEYMVILMIERRQMQTLESGISVADNYNVVDTITGQNVGPSKGASFSYPELLLSIGSRDITKIEELRKFRGGDIEARRDMIRSIMQEGVYKTDQYDGESMNKATELMEVMFKGAHIDSNFTS